MGVPDRSNNNAVTEDFKCWFERVHSGEKYEVFQADAGGVYIEYAGGRIYYDDYFQLEMGPTLGIGEEQLVQPKRKDYDNQDDNPNLPI